MFDSTLDTERTFGHDVAHESNTCSPPAGHGHGRHGARGTGSHGPGRRAVAGPSMEPAARRSYVVRSGDTLWSIAGRVAPGTDPRGTVQRSRSSITWTRAPSRRGRSCSSPAGLTVGGAHLDAPTSCGYGSGCHNILWLHMRCPWCSADDDRVVDSRPAEGGSAIRRRRACQACGRRYSTFERVEDVGLVVIKRDGSKAPFDREKVAGSVRKALKNRPVTPEQLATLVDRVEERCVARGPRSHRSRSVSRSWPTWANSIRWPTSASRASTRTSRRSRTSSRS